LTKDCMSHIIDKQTVLLLHQATRTSGIEPTK
jgi:hypothetical protein